MQARRFAWAGTRASNSGGKLAPVHQHGGISRLSGSRAAMVQPLGCPHSGQLQGSTPVASALAAAVENISILFDLFQFSLPAPAGPLV